jgi:hypothetical protein
VFGLDDASEVVQTTAIWSCLALAMLFAELANNYYDIRAAVSTPAPVRPATQPQRSYSLETSA